MTSDEIREAFLAFFESKGHQRVASSSLIPVGDPTLLLTNAGMVQFKPYFAGESKPPNRRLTSSQKSFRTVDIEEVGDSTHLTLFEMLGNFSIGDYFKEGAIEFALECLDSVMGLPKEKFAATVHESDDEAYELWKQSGIPEERIFRFGDEDNWWGPPIHGTEGPCGPSAELHYDFGAGKGCGEPDCGPNCTHKMPDTGENCDRYVELWNLVFMQFYHHPDGSRDPLPSTGIDTGMGFERLVVVLQGTESIYETDLFTTLIEKAAEISGKSYEEDPHTKYAMRVVTEHARSATFLIADGVVPANEGRGYVLRRVVRRAIRHGRRLGLEDSFLSDLARVVVDRMGDAYPELRKQEEFILTVLKLEEERFQNAFDNGYVILSDAMQDSKSLSGDVAFRLWDTYGFPLEITQEIAAENGVEVDVEGFEKEMAAQRERARASAQFSGDRAKIRVYESLGVGSTSFLGYEQLTASSVLVGLISDGEPVAEAAEGQEVEVVLQQTPFYPEGGGQIGDAGEIAGPSGKISVHDTQTVMPGLIVHFGKVAQGKVAVGDAVDGYVDDTRRQDTARNHTATHMLHAALRQVLGAHVRQAGSLVAPDRLRFDFSHVAQMTAEEIEQVQWLVNERIRQNVSVHKSEDTYTSAIERGALAFFGDKYDASVRLIEIANGETFSFEVCGGTHVERTGELGAVYVLGESSIGAGMRRIEAVSGRGAERLVRERFATENELVAALQAPLPELPSKVNGLLDEVAELRSKNETLQRAASLRDAEPLLQKARELDGMLVLAEKVSVSDMDALREMGDWLRDKLGRGVVVLGTVVNERPNVLVSVSSDLVKDGVDARDLARELGKVIGGGGGGQPQMAQAGGRDVGKLAEALEQAPEIVQRKSAAS